jgi:lysozyme family protein
MLTEEQLVDDVFRREGDTYEEPPRIDQPTGRGGIILGTLSEFIGRQATLQELKDLTHDKAREIVRWKVRRIAAVFKIDAIAFEPLRVQMLDFSYNSGPGLAWRWLQRVLRVPRTGKYDTATAAALDRADAWLVHQALIAARLQMIDSAVDSGAIKKQFEDGLERRSERFSLLEVP